MENDIEFKRLFNEHCSEYKYYPIIMPAIKEDQKIIVLGDLHADFDKTIKILKLAKVIDDNNKWIGGSTYVVQVGDQLDGCRPMGKPCNVKPNNYVHRKRARDIELIEFMNNLSKEADKYDGAVISLLGNHELMNVSGNMSYVSYEDIHNDEFINNGKGISAELARKNDFKPGSKYAKVLACSRLPAVIIGDYIFVHAGFVDKFLETLKIKDKHGLYHVGVLLRKWLLNLIDQDNVINIIKGKEYSMFWDRILGNLPSNLNNNDPQCIEHLEKSLKIFGVGHMFIGHTPQFVHKHGINSTCGDKLWRVDIGMSSGFDGFGSDTHLRGVAALVITGNKGKFEIIKE